MYANAEKICLVGGGGGWGGGKGAQVHTSTSHVTDVIGKSLLNGNQRLCIYGSVSR